MSDQFTIPESALARMPDPVQNAQAEVTTAAAALDRGRAEVASLKAEIQTAPRRDAEELAQAVAAGKPAPAPTLPDLTAKAERGAEAVEVLRKALDGKRAALHRTVVEHLAGCIEVGNAQLDEQKSRAATLIDELGDAIQTLETEAGVLAALGQADDFRDIRGERRLRDLGKLRWGRSYGRLGSELDQLRDLVARFEAVTETAGQRRAREDRESEARREQRARDRAAFSGDGVFVGGGGVIH
jgi:hypothetical protein